MSSKYYKLPADLLTCGLTPRAILLYAVLADRQELSKKSGESFKDKYGTYLIYPVAKLCEVLGVGERTVRYALAELEDAGLIKTKKQGRTRPQKIYISDRKEIAAHEESDRKEIAAHEESDRKEIAAHDRKEIAAHDRKEIAAHNNNTDNNNTDLSSSPAERMIVLLKMIDTAAQDMRVSLTDKQIEKLIKRIRKNADKIGNLQAYLHTAVVNAAVLPDKDDTGFPAAYDIEDYESTSVLDEDDW